MGRGHLHSERGQTSTEYVLVLSAALMLTLAIGLVLTSGIGGAIANTISAVTDAFVAALP